MIASRAPRFFGTVRKLGQSTPAAPHDPRDRVLVRRIAGWEVRALQHGVAARNELSLLQLWQPDVGLSVLTPSHATGHAFEVLSIKGWKVRVPTLASAAAIVKREYDLPFVAAHELERVTLGVGQAGFSQVRHALA